ncbi:binding-protein-dependent transport system inner membrane protein [Natrialba hulunbeirensis JCM 10989]|uniref:Binding-protein-dependent transport system inner membrane protein n=1 Tax=Natrialba hulunbeirensis JCM 10989 TaxID=1227493 RepID=M0A5H0_9EURY|nr:ABC transporter permease subunit [Natrialba hulunbeirensis]ELY93819.1 binding-protein-dependent transport system inner membrane protein [Natrialba hulunbeirensis JCM 10989]
MIAVVAILANVISVLTTWAHEKVTWPMRAARTVRLTLEQVRTGKRSVRDLAKTVAGTGGAIAVLVVLMFPIYWIFTASLSEGAGLMSTEGVFADPSTYNLDAYRWVLFESSFTDALLNSLIVVFVTVSVSMSVVIPGAYALSRHEFRGRKKILYGYVLFTQVGAGLSIATLIALYVLFVNFGLSNNLLVLGLFYAAGAIPFNTWLLKTFMDNIPVSYEEAAVIDGAGRWEVIREVILPLSKPGIAVVLVFTFLAGWNEFIVARTLLSPENYTLSVELYALATAGQYDTPWTQFSAFAILFAMPVALIYFFAQSYVESGLSFGGMEG